MTDFDVPANRRDTHSTKWEKYRDTDILPMWVADMDFKAPPEIIERLRQRSEEGVFGYTDPPDELVRVLIKHLAARYDWHVNEEHLVFIPGVVPGLNIACRGFVGAGQSIITATPVYPPFLKAPRNVARQLIRVPVEDSPEGCDYPIDSLARSIRPETRLLLLCNPFNPLGRLLTKNELADIAQLCLQHDLLICSDEIHCDLLFDDRRHVPMAKTDSAIEENLVTLMAPGKTYNLAGIGGGFSVIKNPELRQRFIDAADGITGDLSLFSYEAMLVAYRDCEPWRLELIAYLQRNRDYLTKRVETIPGITMNRVEATYLAWLDVRQLHLDDPLHFFEAAGVGLSDGEQFDGAGFMRLNFGCPRAFLEAACDRIDKAIRRHLASSSAH